MKRLAMAASIVCSVARFASAQIPAGPEFRVSTNTAINGFNYRSQPVAAASGGEFVVAWYSPTLDGSDYGVRAQRYRVTGAVVGAELQINTYTTGSQFFSGAAVDGRGALVVVWQSQGQDGSDGGVFGQRFDAAGGPRGGEFRVNSYTTGRQGRPRVAADRSGNFVVVWEGAYQDGDFGGIFGQRYDASGQPQGAEFRINSYTTEGQDFPALDMDEAGNFVVVWESYAQDGSRPGIFGQRFNSSGVAQGPEFRANTTTLEDQRQPSVARDRQGNFIVVWLSIPQDGSEYGVFGQRFDASGAVRGSEFRVNTYTTRGQISAAVDADANGNFVVTWMSIGQDGSYFGIFAQRYDSSGAPRGSEFRVNTYTTNVQQTPGVACDSAGNFVIAWTSERQNASVWGVFAQRFGGLRPTGLRVDTLGNAVLEPGEVREVRPTWENVNGAAQTFTATLGSPSGPAGGIPQILDSVGVYGTVPNGASAECSTCYTVSIPNPSPRPSVHWDGAVVETIIPDAQGQEKQWRLHVGESFTDVPIPSGFYRFVETLLHHGVTGGCNATQYCPAGSTTREQMAVFVLVAKEGTGYAPPACTTPVFADVPASSPFCRWIEELARRAIVTGCGGSNYCPSAAVSREEMAVFALRTLDPALTPPACTTPIYNDVPASSAFCRWIEELTRRNVVTGCGGGNYCPAAAVTREQMGVFISATFGLTIYGT